MSHKQDAPPPWAFPQEGFEHRHHGISAKEVEKMLEMIGVSSLEALVNETIPAPIRSSEALSLPPAMEEHELLAHLEVLSKNNQVYRSLMGMGYYNSLTPAVIQRNVLENPAWYTAYTPYQSELAQGRLEALINFQTMVSELTGMEIANASLLDEASAAAEAVTLCWRVHAQEQAHTLLMDASVFPQTKAVLQTRTEPLGIQIQEKVLGEDDLEARDVFALLVQYPGEAGAIKDYSALFQKAQAQDIRIVVCSDLLSLTLLKPPGEMGADVVVGSTQRFGIPLGYGGPHAAYFATKDRYKREMPGRMVGLSVNTQGAPAYRLALQTREQHIRREKATSNICTSQVLLAVMASFYAVYHGPDGLCRIALRIHRLTQRLAKGLLQLGLKAKHTHFFDTLYLDMSPSMQKEVKKACTGANINLRYDDTQAVGISLDEASTQEEVEKLIGLFAQAIGIPSPAPLEDASEATPAIPQGLRRHSAYLGHPVFHRYHSEHAMLRYIKHLESKDLSLVHSMIPLGSCTMKLNAATEMSALSWPAFANIHPYVPEKQAKGYSLLLARLEQWLSAITGFAAISFQPNAGAQGEFAGLMTIRAFHRARGEQKRRVVFIPTSAHGTNPASAKMAGMQVVSIGCDTRGNIDLMELRKKAEKHSQELAAVMITYPSTHGVFEAAIQEVCACIHKHGGQVYMDGANMNAQIGLTSPAIIGADVCHLNLHKTFCIPHGGGGPGMGPIGVATHLVPYLPKHPLKSVSSTEVGAIASAPFGSASILVISYAYIAMMGAAGLRRASIRAILNANYIQARLGEDYPIPYVGKTGRVAHELILDCRLFKRYGISVEDIAKRLMDYGFHAPTISFPMPGTLMIEPTESETKEEIDRFCDAMQAIREEIREVEQGLYTPEDNVLKHAPHSMRCVSASTWNRPYDREKACYPLPYLRSHKFWPATSRIENAYGDRNLHCSCAPLELLESQVDHAEGT